MATIQILDGGLGTSLEDLYGQKFTSTTTPLWASHLLVSDPSDKLLTCQRDFATAGADILLTATYQVSPEGFARTKTAEGFPDGIPCSAVAPFLRRAVDVAESAARINGRRNGAKIALSLGPYGACMIPGQEYSGEYDAEHDSEEALYVWHLDRLRMFAEAGSEADGDMVEKRTQYIAFETLPRLDEVRAVRRAMYESGTKVPFWISCVFPRDGAGEDEALPDGSSVEEVVEAAVLPLEGGAMPWGIGINCTKIHKLPGLVDSLGRSIARAVADGVLSVSATPTLVLYPDGTDGEVYNTTTQVWEKPGGLSSGKMDDARSWEERLAQIINDAYEHGYFSSFLVGGCCKVSHHDIRKLRDVFRST